MRLYFKRKVYFNPGIRFEKEFYGLCDLMNLMYLSVITPHL